MTIDERYKIFEEFFDKIKKDYPNDKALLWHSWQDGFYDRECELIPELEKLYPRHKYRKKIHCGIFEKAWQSGYDTRSILHTKCR